MFEWPVRLEWPVVLDSTLAFEIAGPPDDRPPALGRDGAPGRGDGGALEAGVEPGPVPSPRPKPAFELVLDEGPEIEEEGTDIDVPPASWSG